jgi:hypothetical protein
LPARLADRQIVAPQQHLPRKQRTVERVPAEDVVWQG